MKNPILLFAIFIAIISSCENKGIINQPDIEKTKTVQSNHKVWVYRYEFNIFNYNKYKILDSALYIVDTIQTLNSKGIVFKKSLSDSTFYWHSYYIQNDSFYRLANNHYCPILDTISLNYHDTIIQVFKLNYDILNGNDEESYIFWNPEIGTLADYNYVWDITVIYDYVEYPNLSKVELLNYIIRTYNEKQEKLFIETQKMLNENK